MKPIKILTLILTIISGTFMLLAGFPLLLSTKNMSITTNLYNGLPLVLAVLVGYVGFIVFLMCNKYLIATIFSAVASITIVATGLRFLQLGRGFPAKTFYIYHVSSLILPIIAFIIFLVVRHNKKKELDLAVANNLKK